MTIRELLVTLGLNVDEAAFKRGDIAIGALRAAGEKLVDTLLDVGAQFVENVKKTAEYAETVDGLSQSAGVTADALQRVTAAFKLEGETVEDAGFALTFLNRSMGAAAKGSGEQAQAFRRLGVSVKDAHGKMRSADDVFADLVEKFAAMEDGTEKVNLAMRLFGRGGAGMIQVLNNGAEAAEAMRKASVMTPEQVAAGKDLVVIQRQLAGLTSKLWKEAIAPLLPAVRDLVKQYAAWRKANADVMHQRITEWLGVAVKAVKVMGQVLGTVIEHWKGFAVALAAVGAVKLAYELTQLSGAAWKAGIKAAAAGALATAGWAVLLGAVGAVVGLINDVDTYKNVEKWNKLHPDKAVDPKKYSLFARYKDAIDSWLQPNATDPWWLKAAKALVAQLEKALGLILDIEGKPKTAQRLVFGITRGDVVVQRNALIQDIEGKPKTAQGPAPGTMRGDVVVQRNALARFFGSEPEITRDQFGNQNVQLGWLDRFLGSRVQYGPATDAYAYARPAAGGGSVSQTNHLSFTLNGDPEANRRMINQVLDERGVVDASHLEAAAATIPGT